VSILDTSRRNIVIDTYIIHTDIFCTEGEKIILLIKFVFSEVRARSSCFIILHCSIPMCFICFSSCTLSHVTVYKTLSWFTHSSSGTTVADVRKYCYIYEVSLDTRQQRTALDSIVTQQCNQAIIEFYSNNTVDYRLLFQSGVTLGCEGTARKSIVGAGKWQVNDGLYAEVPLWCASGPIARRWIVPTCVWKLSDCKNGSECWKIATRRPVGRIL
jgi:hypothetical protein